MTPKNTGFRPESLRLIAAALALHQAERIATSITPLPGTDRFIAIGTPAEVARLLEIAPAASQSPAPIPEQVAPSYWNSQRKMIERAIVGLRDGWATRQDADAALAVLGSSYAPNPEQVAQASGIGGLTRYRPIGLNTSRSEADGEFVKFEDARALLATQSAKQSNLQEENRQMRQRIEDLTTAANQCINDAIGQSAKQGAQPSEPYAYEEDNGADTELVYAAWFKNGLGKMDPDSIYRPLYLGQPPTAPLQTMDDTTQAAREQSEPAGYISSAAAALIKAKKSGPVSVGVSVSPIHADADVAIYFAAPASTAPKQALSTMADSLPANLVTQVPPNVRDQAPGDSK